MIRLLMITVVVFTLSLALAPSHAQAGHGGRACSVGGSGGQFVRGQPLLNVGRFVLGTNRRANRRANGTALVEGIGGQFVRGQPLLNVGRFVLGTNRRANRRAGRACN